MRAFLTYTRHGKGAPVNVKVASPYALPPREKRCSCPLHKGKVIPKTEFSLDTKSRDGLQRWCRKGNRHYQMQRKLLRSKK